ncbi:hypothetical protein ACR79N_16190 [Sphingobacterium siyangense]|uniref:hypothetical protein n=1 Tax=Sphingobacterium siyangense TaxID=459529 RepID=UPI003DA3C7D1
MADDKYAEGWKGILSIWDSTASAYKPLACLTQTSHAMNGVTTEKVNMCTQGKTITKLKSITETVDFEGEVIDTTSVGGQSAKASLADLKEIMRNEANTGKIDDFRLSRDFDGELYFPGQIITLTDTYQADADATFSGQMSLHDAPSEIDPHSTPTP